MTDTSNMTLADWLAQPVVEMRTEHYNAMKPTKVVDQGLQHEHGAINGYYPYASRPKPQPVGMQTGLNDLTGESQLYIEVYDTYTPVSHLLLEPWLSDGLPPAQPSSMNHNTSVIDYDAP